MRWLPVIILAWLMLLVQVTAARLIELRIGSLPVRPDLMAATALFLALFGRELVEIMTACWILGLLTDLTAAGGAGAVTAVGPMAVAYSLAGACVFGMREAFFRDRLLPQALLGLVLALLAHGMWVTAQCLLARSVVDWGLYGRLMAQAALTAAYTAVIAPLLLLGLMRLRPLLLAPDKSRRR